MCTYDVYVYRRILYASVILVLCPALRFASVDRLQYLHGGRYYCKRSTLLKHRTGHKTVQVPPKINWTFLSP